jgi:hypothetical protein
MPSACIGKIQGDLVSDAALAEPLEKPDVRVAAPRRHDCQ